jgi:hypothetical protein
MNRHAWDTLSLVFGVTFLVVAAAWMVTRLAAVQLPSAGWIAASGLVLLGIVGLISTLLPRHGGTPGR